MFIVVVESLSHREIAMLHNDMLRRDPALPLHYS